MKRYRLVKGAEWALFEREEGEYYKVSDVDPILAENEELKAENEKLKNKLEEMIEDDKMAAIDKDYGW